MTKEQLLRALSHVPDGAKVFVRCVATSNNLDHMLGQARADMADGSETAELATLMAVEIVDDDGPGAPAFAIITHHVQYLHPRSVGRA